MKSEKEFIEKVRDYIIRVHNSVVSINSDPKELRQGTDLFFIVYRALQKSKGDNIDFALYLMKLIAEEHPFVEGNKRTAYIVGKGLLFFEGNKLICITKKRAELFLKLIAIRSEKENPKELREIKKFILESSKDFPSNLLGNLSEFEVFIKKQPKVRSKTIKKYLRRLSLELKDGK